MMVRMKGKRHKVRQVLVVDVGGSHVKMRSGTRGAIREFKSGSKLRARPMVEQVLKLTRDWRYDVVAIGFPGVVVHGKIAAEPHNLGSGWLGFDFQKAFDKPVRLVNDAAMQAMGGYKGGRMLFLGLGTGLGVTLIVNGVVEPMELGHMPYRHGRTYEDYVGERGYRRLGTRKWRKVVAQVVDQLRTVLEADYVVLGGGNVKKLKTLPAATRRGDNHNAFIGGVRLWEQAIGQGTGPKLRLQL